MSEKEFKPELHIHRDGNPPTKEELLRAIRDYYTPLLEVTKPGGVIDTSDTPEDKREEYRQMYSKLKEIRDSWEEAEREYLSPDTPEERKKEIAYSVEEWYLNLVLLHAQNPDYFSKEEVKLPDYRIVIDTETGERKEYRGDTHLWGDKYFIPGKGILALHPGGMRDPLEDLEKIRDSAKSGLVKVSSDLWKSGTAPFRDSLGISIISEKTRRIIQKKEAEGKLLAGTLIGLKGGGRYFKVFNIALAQTLYEQSKYYNTQDNLSGVPRDLISQYAGEGAIVEKIKDTVWMGLEYFCNEGDWMWSMTDEEFGKMGISEMVKMGLIDSESDVIDFHVERVKKAYPAYFDTYDHMDDLRAYLDTIPNLFCVGRNGQHRYNNIDHSMCTSFETVKAILSGSTDKSAIWNVNTEKEYHEQGKEE